MMSEADRQKAAEWLVAAERDRKPIVQLSKTFPDITIDDAYAISALATKIRVAAGHKVIGNKIGLTSKAMQASSQIDEPDYGVLHDYMMIDDGAKIPHDRFCVPRVEIELVFVLKSVLQGPGVGLMDVLRATEYVCPAMEIVDARVQNPRKIYDTVADNGAAAGLVMGGASASCAGNGDCVENGFGFFAVEFHIKGCGVVGNALCMGDSREKEDREKK